MATVDLAGTILLCHALSTQQPRNSAALENPWEVQVSIGRPFQRAAGGFHRVDADAPFPGT